MFCQLEHIPIQQAVQGAYRANPAHPPIAKILFESFRFSSGVVFSEYGGDVPYQEKLWQVRSTSSRSSDKWLVDAGPVSDAADNGRYPVLLRAVFALIFVRASARKKNTAP